jgi:hypothetical protein
MLRRVIMNKGILRAAAVDPAWPPHHLRRFLQTRFRKIFAEGESPNDVLYTSEDAFIPTADVAGKALSD